MESRLIELLAPAKDLQTGIEAIKHGADAVYIGAPKFGARAAAGNSVDDIRQLVEFARPYGVKIYVTLNTILYDNELDEVRQLVEELERAGVDALIVQDFSLVTNYESQVTNELETRNSRLGTRNLELGTRNSELGTRNLSLHASTQMDNRTAEKVAWLRDLGFEQVVLARELTLEEIREIHEKVPDVSLEVFVHGAICVSYNGQCYASQYCFGRSANRGECAQFCRMPFDLVDEEGRVLQKQKHLLSLRDMNRSDDLEALLDAGASSLKIEGRLKDVSYVKNVVAYYRQRLDEIFRRRHEYRRSSLGHETINFTPNPAKSFNRLFTDYFLHGRTPDMANIHTPKSMGERMDSSQFTVHSSQFTVHSSQFIVHSSQLHNGDGLCYINEEGELKGFRINRIEGNKIYPANCNGNPSSFTFDLRSTFLLYRNHDQEFEQQLSKPTATRKVGVRWLLKETEEGFLLRLTREDGMTVEQAFPYLRELARSSQKEQITRQLSRLGETPYEATAVDIEMSQEWFIPGSVLADWRREISEEMKTRISDKNSSVPHSLTSSLPHSITTEISYLGNVANHAARQFYLDHGAQQVEWAMEVQDKLKTKGEKQKADDSELLLMTCRYCIRHELGMCNRIKNEKLKIKNDGRELFLRLADGRQFRLHFDCRQCQMKVYAVKG